MDTERAPPVIADMGQEETGVGATKPLSCHACPDSQPLLPIGNCQVGSTSVSCFSPDNQVSW